MSRWRPDRKPARASFGNAAGKRLGKGGLIPNGIRRCIPIRYTQLVATEQIAVRLPQELLAEVDQLVARGIYGSRAAVVRAGLEAVAESERRRLIDSAVIEGYRRIPSGETEHAAAVASLRDAILDEPW